MSQFVDSLTAAIGRYEGYGASPTNRPTRNNNPGNLRERPANDARGPKWPQYQTDAQGYVIFPTADVGWSELKARVQSSIDNGSTLTSLLNVFAPATENNTAKYIATVAGWLGISADSRLSDHADSAPVVEASSILPKLPGVSGTASLALLAALAVGGVALWFLVFD